MSAPRNTIKPATLAALANFGSMPDEAFVRAPVVAALLGICEGSVWRHSRLGTLPKPEKITPNTTGWRVGALRKYRLAAK